VGAFDVRWDRWGETVVLDEHDPAASLVGRQASAAGEGSFVDDGLYIVGDRVFVARGLRAALRAERGDGDEDADAYAEPMSVACYELIRNP